MAEEVLVVAVAVPHGLTALHAVQELDLDGWDLPVRIQVIESLRNVGDWRPKGSISSFHIVALLRPSGICLERDIFLAQSSNDVTINSALN